MKSLLLAISFILFTGCSSKETFIKHPYVLKKKSAFTLINPIKDPINLATIFKNILQKHHYSSILAHPIDAIHNKTKNSQGSGFFINSKGYIVTNYHVVQGHDYFHATTHNQNFMVQIIDKDKKRDIAILKPTMPFKTTHFLNLSSYKPQIGSDITVIGFPLTDVLGEDVRLTQGIISSINGIKSNKTQFQMSASIQPGNSGGPIINNSFQVEGIATSRLSDTYLLKYLNTIPQNINFGVKSQYIKALLKQNNIMFSTSSIKNLQDAVKAVVLLKSSNEAPIKVSSNNLKLKYSYQYFWEFDSISYLNIKILLPNNKEIIEGIFSGDSLSSPRKIAEDLLLKMLQKISKQN